jgi:hypothetical protein
MRLTAAKVFPVLVLMLAVSALTGCTGNNWTGAYTPGPLAADALAAPGLIRPEVRVVMPERMLDAMDAEAKFLAGRSRTRMAASPREQRDLQRIQFPMLGVYNDPDTTMLIGTAEVTADKPIDPNDPGIAASAQDAGASLVVVSVFPPGTPGGVPIQTPAEGERGRARETWRSVAWYYAPAR